MSRGAILIAVAVLAIITIALVATYTARYDRYIAGMWVGDPAFMERAQLTDLQLFIAPAEGGARQGYLIMVDNEGNYVSNQAIEIRFGRHPLSATRASLSTKDAYKGAAEIEYDAEPPMPARLQLSASMLDGTLTLYDAEKVYAFFVKDAAASVAAVAAYEAPS